MYGIKLHGMAIHVKLFTEFELRLPPATLPLVLALLSTAILRLLRAVSLPLIALPLSRRVAVRR